MIRGGGTWTHPVVRRIEPLRGTDDILVTVCDAASPIADLCRIDPDGNQVWYYDGGAYGHPPSNAGHSFGADGTYIAVQVGPVGGSQGLAGLDYDANPLWLVYTLPMRGVVLVSPNGAQIEIVRTGTSPAFQKYDMATGSLLNQSGTGIVGSPSGPNAIRQSDGYFLVSFYSGGGAFHRACVLENVAYNVFKATAADEVTTTARWNDGNNIVVSLASTHDILHVVTTFIDIVWTKATIFGSSPQNIDVDNDSTGCYFGGQPVGSPKVNVYKRDNVYGNVLWGQDVLYNGVAATSTCWGLAVADDGYLYAGGSPV